MKPCPTSAPTLTDKKYLAHTFLYHQPVFFSCFKHKSNYEPSNKYHIFYLDRKQEWYRGLTVLFIIHLVHIIFCHYWSSVFIFLQAAIFILALPGWRLLNLNVFRTHSIFHLDASRKKTLKDPHKVVQVLSISGAAKSKMQMGEVFLGFLPWIFVIRHQPLINVEMGIWYQNDWNYDQFP